MIIKRYLPLFVVLMLTLGCTLSGLLPSENEAAPTAVEPTAVVPTPVLPTTLPTAAPSPEATQTLAEPEAPGLAPTQPAPPPAETTATLEPPAAPAPADRGKLVYIGLDGNLWLYEVSAGALSQVTGDAGPVVRYGTPKFSPDGDKVAYCRYPADDSACSNAELQIYELASGASRPLASGLACSGFSAFSWSPDGGRIVFGRGGFEADFGDGGIVWRNASGIWQVNTASGALGELISPLAGNPLVSPSFSPDGAWISYREITYIEGVGAFRTQNLASGAIFTWDSIPVGGVDWAPDGSRLAFDEVTYVASEGQGLFLGTPDGSNVHRIYGDPGLAIMAPRWSPDGSRILAALSVPFSMEDDQKFGVIGQDGSLSRSFAAGQNTFSLGWSPDGLSLLFYRLDTQGGAGSLFTPYELLSFDLAQQSFATLGQGAFHCGYGVADWGR